jgi:hypothetical protein
MHENHLGALRAFSEFFLWPLLQSKVPSFTSLYFDSHPICTLSYISVPCLPSSVPYLTRLFLAYRPLSPIMSLFLVSLSHGLLLVSQPLYPVSCDLFPVSHPPFSVPYNPYQLSHGPLFCGFIPLFLSFAPLLYFPSPVPSSLVICSLSFILARQRVFP